MTKALAFALLCILLYTHADTISRHTLDLSAYLGRVTQCPAFSTSNADNSACICIAGYFRSGNSCVQCAAGTFKDTSGDQACSDCSYHFHALSSSAPGADSIDACLCEPGLWHTQATCQNCPIGTYTSFHGAKACTTCPDNSNTASVKGNALTACQCNAGFTGPNGGPCTGCDAGSYKPAPGSQPCTGCPNHMTSPAESTSLTQCQCLPGFTGTNGGSCAPCSPGTFKTSTGEASCSLCLDNTESTEGASACVAKPGFTIRNRVRFTMRISKTLAQFDEAAQQLYKQDIATRASVDVSQVTIISITEVQGNVLRRLLSTSLDVETEISTAPEETDSVTTAITTSTNSSSDETLIGDTTTSTASEACAENTYKADSGDEGCTPCPANSFSASGSTACTCNPGYRGDFLNCQVCAVDHYCIGDGTMVECPANSTSPQLSVSEDNCTCLGGFQKIDDE